jgi:hypothetical protein
VVNISSKLRTILFFQALVLSGTLANATADSASPSETLKTIEAHRISEPIELDGLLTEEAWLVALAGTDFVQREPATGEAASERTEIRVVYTATTLYVGIMAFDAEPDKIISKEMQRDQPLWRDDAIDILFDTFDDDRNAYLFETNPNGARTDALITDEGRDFNLQWDGVWDVAAQLTDEGWSAELAIPFSTLRFDPMAESWGFNALRYIRRRAEQAFWAPILLDADVKRVSLYGRLTGIRGVEPGWNLNVKPFTSGKSVTASDFQLNQGAENDLDFGLDVKYGVTRGLSLDGTVNTDFAETEVDALQVNLTRFSLFFPEKREFFLENAGIFEFGSADTDTSAPLLKIFHSRRIGIDRGGEEVPINWGARLTGRAGGGWNVGVLNVQTRAVEDLDVSGNNWTAFRVSRNFDQRSNFGMIYTQRIDEGNTNRVFGPDIDYKPTPQLGLNGYFAASDNTLADSKSDWSAGAGATWAGPIWKWNVGWVRIGEDFDPQMGFLLRSGVHRVNGRATYEPRPSTPKLMNLHFELDGQIYTGLDGEVETELFRADLFGLRTASANEATVFVTRTTENLRAPFALVPDVIIPTGEHRFNTIGVRGLTHSSRPVSVEGRAEFGGFYDGNRTIGSFTLRLRPNRFIRSETTWEFNDIDLPSGEITPHILRQRFAVALTPRLLSNLFVQYNSLVEQTSLNLRFNWIYRPGADLFVVYTETWDPRLSSIFPQKDRRFIVKFTYLYQR